MPARRHHGFDQIARHARALDVGSLRVAIVHDLLTGSGGPERVLRELVGMFPGADLFTLADSLPLEERAFLRNRPVHASFLSSFPGMGGHDRHRWLFPLGIEQFDLSCYDLVISNSGPFAKGVVTGPHQLHVCYLHSVLPSRPPRWPGARLEAWLLRLWDMRTANGVDRFIAGSPTIARWIAKTYRRDSAVLPPPGGPRPVPPRR